MDFESLRESYRPDNIKILFVGESPPVSGTFFYTENSILYHATRAGFSQALPHLKHAHFLSAFRDLGCYLEDLCAIPVNHLGDFERERERVNHLPRFTEILRQISPVKVVVVMKQITPYVLQAIDTAHSDADLYSLSFPRNEHRHKYIAELKHLLSAFEGEGLLDP